MLLQKTRADRWFVQADDPDALVARLLTRDDRDVAARQIESGGQEGDEGVVGRSLHRRGGEANEDRPVALAVDARARRARNHADA